MLTRKLNECASLLLLSYIGLPILVGLIMTIIYTYVASFTRHVITAAMVQASHTMPTHVDYHEYTLSNNQ